ncbi:hypothetical protein, partial [Streptococcus iniae]|uniref:hypothetical protein n=2 Tax=Streptococcus iniae TaxID=1346 RepID=UPI00217DC70F
YVLTHLIAYLTNIQKLYSCVYTKLLTVSLKNYILKNIILTKNEKIKKITFIQFEKDDIAGNWLITVKINNKYLMSLSEDKLGGQIRTSGYSSNELKEKKLSSSEINNENIEVDYFEGEYIRF